MESLYVCLFSNGHIKVGRSIEPKARIAAHVERVACLGVELADGHVVSCVGPAAPRETRLIAQCSDCADARYQNEWFSGLDFLTVCAWADDAAKSEQVTHHLYAPDSFGSRLRAARIAAGLTQTELARGMGFNGEDLNKAAISTWEVGRNFPNVKQLRALCVRLDISADSLVFGEERAKAAQSRIEGADPSGFDSLISHGSQFCPGEPLNATQLIGEQLCRN